MYHQAEYTSRTLNKKTTKYNILKFSYSRSYTQPDRL